MKKIIATFIAILIVNVFLYAQAREGTIKIKKVEEPAIIMVYNYPKEIVEAAFVARLADKRLQGDKRKGFLEYNNSSISEISSTPLDYSFKFDESGRRSSTKTTVYMLMRGNQTIDRDPGIMANNAKSFMEKMIPDVEKSHTIFRIKKQEEVMVKEEKKLRELKNEQSDLEKKLDKNKKEQTAQEKIIQSQKNILADLKSSQ